MGLGEPDASGRRRPVPTGRTAQMPADLVIMALGNTANPIIKDSEPRLSVSPFGTIQQAGDATKETTPAGRLHRRGRCARRLDRHPRGR